MEFKQKMYGTFDDHGTNNAKICCCWAFAGCAVAIAIIIFLTFSVGFNVAMIFIGTQHSNTTCDNDFHAYRLSEWLIIFGSVNLTMFGIYIFIVDIVYCMASSDRIAVPIGIQMVVILSWLVFTLIMTIMGIIELAHVFQKCIVEEYALSVTVLVVVILNCVYMCGGASRIRSN